MKKYVGILKSRELVIQKQFLHEKKKKTKSFAGATWYFSWSPHRLAQMLLSSVLPLLHHMPGVSFINMISANNNESVALKGQISFS